DLVPLDGSWHLPAEQRDPEAEFLAAHVPGARFFDIDAVSDHASPLPHTLSSPEAFAASMKQLGVGSSDCIVVYDASGPGLTSAARVWWNFRVMGHDNVAVLDGGFRKWKAEDRPLAPGPASARSPAPFIPHFRSEMVRGLEDIRRIVTSGEAQIVDARG